MIFNVMKCFHSFLNRYSKTTVFQKGNLSISFLCNNEEQFKFGGYKLTYFSLITHDNPQFTTILAKKKKKWVTELHSYVKCASKKKLLYC